MAKRTGKRTILFENKPHIISYGSVVGKKEHEGPLSAEFDRYITDSYFGEKTYERAESRLQKTAVQTALDKVGLKKDNIDCILAGDLLNQCIGSSFGLREFGIPFIGLYGACSTMALSTLVASLLVDSAAAKRAIAVTSSHFCSAERQYRFPLDYGSQRTPTAQWTVTGSGKIAEIVDDFAETFDAYSIDDRSEHCEAGRNLILAQKLKAELESMGASVIMTRYDNASGITFRGRMALMRNESPDLCISIHHDSSTAPTVNGFGAFHSTVFSKKAAEFIQMRTYNTGIYAKVEPVRWHYFFLARSTVCPVVLTENGYISSPADFAGIKNDAVNTQKAKAIASGVADYFNSIRNR